MVAVNGKEYIFSHISLSISQFRLKNSSDDDGRSQYLLLKTVLILFEVLGLFGINWMGLIGELI